MERSDVAQLLIRLAAAYRAETDEFQAEVWYEHLHTLEARHVTQAMTDWILNEDRFPSIAQIRRGAIRRSRRERDYAPLELLPPLDHETNRHWIDNIRAQIDLIPRRPEPERVGLARTGGCGAEGPHTECEPAAL